MDESLIGIDIGSGYTKVVEIEQKVKPNLLNAFIFKTPFLPFQEETSLREIDIESFWKEISAYIPLSKVRKSKVGINIPPQAITTIPLLLPQMKRSELSEAAIVEAKRKMIPASGPGHLFEWLFLGEKVVFNIPRYEVLVVRTEKSYIQQLMNLFKNIHTSPIIITPSCSILPHLVTNEVWRNDGYVAFIDLGWNNLNISVCQARKMVFTRNVNIGFGEVVKDIAHRMDVSVELIEKIIADKGIPDVDFDLGDKVALAEQIMRRKYEASPKAEGSRQEEVNLLELRVSWQVHLDRILHEIRRSFTYYKEQAGGKRIEDLYFLGGGSQVKNLVKFLIKQMGGSWQVILPFKGMQVAQKEVFADEISSTPIFANATSLALTILTKVRKNEEIINFLPLELKRKEIVVIRRMVLSLIGISLGVILALIYINALIDLYSHRSSIRQVDSELSRLKNINDRLRHLSQEDKRIEQRGLAIEAIIKQRQDFYLLLKELARVIPQQVLIIKINISKGGGGVQPSQTEARSTEFKLSIDAKVFVDYEEASEIIENFRHSLESMSFFKDVEITPLKLEKISLEESAKSGKLTKPQERAFVLTAIIVNR